MNEIAFKCRELLSKEGIDILSQIDFKINDKIKTVTFEYIIDTFMMSSHESQLIFLAALQKSINSKEGGVEKFFEGMGQLLLMTHLSKNIEV
ncbi:hypothetical protein [Sulfurimonas sp.]|uniref:hypothetical protein n=1 Tax=Sulfurimonas sp. TaxID=2022749 RepID=UPI00286E2D19|nr:hypothetical protein [Sulfurimonas sp.]